MRWAKSAVMTSFLLLVVFAASPAQAAQAIAWADLVDKTAQHFEDPYRTLQLGHLDLLVSVNRLRQMLKRNKYGNLNETTLKQKLKAGEKKLAAAGVDVNWLISQRWTVARQRERAATAGNTYLDGKDVIIAGFAIPASADPDGTPTAYLVPERGMCSHMPPPPPNQLIRLRLKGSWAPSRLHAPVRVRGRLRIAPSRHRVFIVDGRVPMRSTFEIRGAQAIPVFRTITAPVPLRHQAIGAHRKD